MKLLRFRAVMKIFNGNPYILMSEGKRPEAIPILVSMIESEDDEVSIAAADSLRECVGGGTPVGLTPKARERLKAIAANGKINGMILEQLFKQLGE